MDAAAKPPGVIRADEAYSVAEFRRRAGLGNHSWRNVRQKLRVIALGKKRYVLGADWLDFLHQLTREDE